MISGWVAVLLANLLVPSPLTSKRLSIETTKNLYFKSRLARFYLVVFLEAKKLCFLAIILTKLVLETTLKLQAST